MNLKPYANNVPRESLIGIAQEPNSRFWWKLRGC